MVSSSKKLLAQWPFLIAVAILLVVVYIVGRNESSPIAKMTQWVSTQLEGFASPTPLSTPQCPAGFTFFNDSQGESFCCSGEINRYSHKCVASGINQLCSMKKGVKDPRDSTRTLSWCSDLINNIAASTARTSCPGRLPNYGRIGKCCASATDLDGYDCSAADNADTRQYCIVSGTPKPGEQLCSQLIMDQNASCPAGLNKITYTMGAKEQNKYGSAANGKQIPVCFGMDSACIPDNVVGEMKKQGIYRDKGDPASWLYACSGWERVKVKRDLTGKIDNNYL